MWRAVALVAILTGGLGQCQTHVTVESVTHSPMPVGQTDSILSQIRYLNGVKWDSLHDDAVESVVAGARANFADYFTCSLSESVETKLVPIDGEPILAARWPGGCGPAIGEVRLWDEPTFTTYYFRLPKEAALHAEVVAAAMEELIRWDHGIVQSIKLSVHRPSSQQTWLGYGTPTFVPMIPRQFDTGGRFLAFWVHADAATAWLSVSLGKDFVGHYPPDMKWIRERFPPLRLRLTKLTNSEIVEQTRSAKCFYGAEKVRCQVLISDALRRDLNADEFRLLISGPSVREVLAAAESAGILPRYRDALVARLMELPTDTRPGPSRGKMTDTPQEAFLSSIVYAKSVDLTPEVFDLFLSGRFRSFGGGYLVARIQTLANAYDFVQILTQRREEVEPGGLISAITRRMRLAGGANISAPLAASLHIELLDVPFVQTEADFPVSESWRQVQFQNLKQALAASTEPLTVVVEGHAAPDEGDAESCMALGARRAEAVKAALEQAGIPADRIRTVSVGSSRPYCADSDPQRDCAAWNRRVHFTY